jgi:hypothetical protein
MADVPTSRRGPSVLLGVDIVVWIVLLSLVAAVLMRSSVVKAILDYFNILGLVGVSVAMGLLWRRMNTPGVFASVISAVLTFLVTRYVLDCPRDVTICLPIAAGVVCGVVGSLASAPPDRARIEEFFGRVYTPVGEEEMLGRLLDEVVPPSRRLFTAGGLFVVRPTRESWLGFVAVTGACVACVLVMLAVL